MPVGGEEGGCGSGDDCEINTLDLESDQSL